MLHFSPLAIFDKTRPGYSGCAQPKKMPDAMVRSCVEIDRSMVQYLKRENLHDLKAAEAQRMVFILEE